MDTLDLSAFFITKAEATDFSVRLAKVMDRIYTTDFVLENVISEQFGIHKKDLILKLFQENAISETTPTAIQPFIKTIQDTIAKLPVITLTIAFEPKEETLKAFSEWFIFTLKKQVVFSLEIDKTLLAGARIICNGTYKDYSVQTKFMTLLENFLHPKTEMPAPTQTPPSLPPQATPSQTTHPVNAPSLQ